MNQQITPGHQLHARITFRLSRPVSAMRRLALILLLALGATCAGAASAQDELGRRALEHGDYDAWNSVGQQSLSEDGAWISYVIRPADGSASTLVIREAASQTEYIISNGASARFSYDSQYVAYLINPDPDLIKKLREQDTTPAELPKRKLEILDLSNGRHVTIADVQSFSFPEKASGWIAYVPIKPAESQTVSKRSSKIKERYRIEEGELARAGIGQAQSVEGDRAGVADQGDQQRSGRPVTSSRGAGGNDKENGGTLVLRDLATGIEQRFPNVTSHGFSKYGSRLAFATSATDAEDDGVVVVDLATGERSQIASGRGNYQSLAFSEDENSLAFVTDRDNFGPVKPSVALYLWSEGQEQAELIVNEQTEGMPGGWWIASTRPTFTEDGRGVVFDTQPKPDGAGKTKEELEKEQKAESDDPQAVLDVWHWKDPFLQPQQLLQAERERRRSYRALFDLQQKQFVQLATPDIPNVFVDVRSSADITVGISSLPYDISRSWESPGFSDSYLIDINSGQATRVLERARGTASPSPDGKYIAWWDPEQHKYFVMSVADREAIDVSEDIPTSLANELQDTPSPPRSYGVEGWTADDAALLLYDRFDIWLVDPTGEQSARCLTEGHGRESTTRYRYVRLDNEQRTINLDEPLMLSAFNEMTKASGYSTLDASNGEIASLIMLDESVGSFRKAQQGDTVLLTRQTFRRYPDLWATTMDFQEMARISQANPQQRDYLWGTAELVQYQSTDGHDLQGIVYKPDNFDPDAKYPMMVYFYERSSDGLHRYITPSAGSSSINHSFYVSRGYVVFVPDIPYHTGYPGRSAADAVLPGVQAVVDLGFVDEARIGVQGHSWGGYQIAYLVTRSNVFACAESGAPVSNMTSAYGGIRWASGMSRMFQYEKTQSRIGGTLWDARDLYLENSPVFFADQIETPLLMLHNDEDGAVPWYQGIELFVAMRRLSKPVWLLNYNGEAHGLRRPENRLDFAKRMQQFFDHYLMGAPAPRWLAEGVPAVDKGKDLGLGFAGEEKKAEAAHETEEQGGERE